MRGVAFGPPQFDVDCFTAVQIGRTLSRAVCAAVLKQKPTAPSASALGSGELEQTSTHPIGNRGPWSGGSEKPAIPWLAGDLLNITAHNVQ